MLPMKQLSIGCFLKVFSQHDQDRFFIAFSHLFYISCLMMFILWTHTQCFLPLFAHCLFLASQDALEVMRVTHSLSHLLTESWLADSTDVTLVSEDTY